MENIHTFVVLAYKESQYLENCILSVLNQDFKSKVVIATSTPNQYIQNLADKYSIDIVINKKIGMGIGYDFDFARLAADSKLITVAHQDDTYDRDYSKKIVEAYKKRKDALIIFSNYYEIRNDEKVYNNLNLKIKSILLTPLRIPIIKNLKFFKRLVLSFGDPICCPAVTFINSNIKEKRIFDSDFKCNIDWYAWEKLSNKKGKFVYLNKKMMGHRVHEESTTSIILEENLRTIEDLEMLECFWPKGIAKLINRFYSNAEKSNKLD